MSDRASATGVMPRAAPEPGMTCHAKLKGSTTSEVKEVRFSPGLTACLQQVEE